MTALNPAPLAQLHDHDRNLWAHLYAEATTRSPNPGTDTLTQALAAALLGDTALAEAILRNGVSYYRTREWPVLTGEEVKPKPPPEATGSRCPSCHGPNFQHYRNCPIYPH